MCGSLSLVVCYEWLNVNNVTVAVSEKKKTLSPRQKLWNLQFLFVSHSEDEEILFIKLNLD